MVPVNSFRLSGDRIIWLLKVVPASVCVHTCVMCPLEILTQLVSTNVLINLWWQCKVSKQLCSHPEQTYSLSETGPVCRYCCLKCSPIYFLIPTANHAEIDSMALQSLLHTPFSKGNRIQSCLLISVLFTGPENFIPAMICANMAVSHT